MRFCVLVQLHWPRWRGWHWGSRGAAELATAVCRWGRWLREVCGGASVCPLSSPAADQGGWRGLGGESATVRTSTNTNTVLTTHYLHGYLKWRTGYHTVLSHTGYLYSTVIQTNQTFFFFKLSILYCYYYCLKIYKENIIALKQPLYDLGVHLFIHLFIYIRMSPILQIWKKDSYSTVLI